MKKKTWAGILIFLTAGIMLFSLYTGRNKQNETVFSYPEFWRAAERGEVQWVSMGDGERWKAGLTDGRTVTTPNPRADDGKERLLALGIEVKEENGDRPELVLLLLGLIGFGFILHARREGAMGLKKYAEIKPDEAIPHITLSDVAAPPETMQSMKDLAAFLREPERFRRCGARPPRGVMLYGPPGTGKTMLARALAGEAKAPFFAMSGADFVQVYVGVGASRVRELFRKARKAGSGVIFIDEIDAIGKKRDNGNDEREQTLNALLTEMSGFSGADGIMVVAATNRVDTLDEALLREGRFDRRIEVGLPDRDQRLKILEVHAREKPLSANVSLQSWAQRTAMFSGAQLEAMLNEAAIRAVRRSGNCIEENDMERAFCALTVGDEQPRLMTGEEKRTLAYHEAGHALITFLMLPDHHLTKITVIPSSRGAAGYSMSVLPDRLLYTKKELIAMICAALGGRAAEEMILGMENVTTGAANDLKKAREIAKAMTEEFGMGETGQDAEDEKMILRAAMETARKCLDENRSRLETLAQGLLEKETLLESDIAAILNGKPNNEKNVFA